MKNEPKSYELKVRLTVADAKVLKVMLEHHLDVSDDMVVRRVTKLALNGLKPRARPAHTYTTKR